MTPVDQATEIVRYELDWLAWLMPRAARRIATRLLDHPFFDLAATREDLRQARADRDDYRGRYENAQAQLEGTRRDVVGGFLHARRMKGEAR